MFNNIGKKIKLWAKIQCWVGIVMSVVSGFIMLLVFSVSSAQFSQEMNLYENSYYYYHTIFNPYPILIFFSILIMIVGPFLSYISSFKLYGFGELIDKTCDISLHITHKNTSNVTVDEKEQRLSYLHKQGLISDQEYNNAKFFDNNAGLM